MGSGVEVITSPPLNRKLGCLRSTMIRARCLRLKQRYPAQNNNQKNCMCFLSRGKTAVRRDELYSSCVGPFAVDKWS